MYFERYSLVSHLMLFTIKNNLYISFVEKSPWPESARELYRPSDRRLSAMLVPTFADKGCHMVSVTVVEEWKIPMVLPLANKY
jgi:hypothetical protein